MLTGNFENNPVRQITGRAELLGGSATSVMGSSVVLDDLYPIPHDIKISAKSENLANPYEWQPTSGYGTARVEGNNIIITPRADGTFYGFNPPASWYSILEEGETYTFSMDSVSGHSGSWGWRKRYKNGTYGPVNYSTSITVKWENLMTIPFYFGMPYTSNEEIVITNLQVRKASEVLPFVPYVETKDIVISATGRNLMLWNDYEITATNVDSYCRDGVIGRIDKYPTGITTSWISGESFGMNDTNFPNPYLEPGTYIFTGEWVSIPSAYAKSKIYLGLEYEDGTTADWYSGNVLTPTQRVKIISVRCENVSIKLNEVMECRLMIEYGTEAHPYSKAFIDEVVGSGTIGSNGSFVQAHATLPANTYLQVDYLKQTNESFTHNGDLQSITIDRAGANKFFGFGICQKANIKIRDIERQYKIDTSSLFDIYFNDVLALPRFQATETHRDENTNALSITAYDAIYQADKHTVNELNLESYTISEFVRRCGSLLGVDVVCPSAIEFNASYPSGANFEGTETIREALDAVAEATQTIYYINADNKLIFKRISPNADANYTIDKSQYITLNSKSNRRLAKIASITELGDNYEASLNVSGTTQYIRNNPFWELREDVATLVDNALAAMGGMTINQFDCSWRGNYLLEPCDKIALITKDNEEVYSYLFNDKIEYNGAFSQKTSWEYADEVEEQANSTSLGDVLKQTYARVDKQNKQIDLVASDVQANSAAIASLQINTDSIVASVSSMETKMEYNNETMTESLIELTNRVNATMTDTEVQLAIEKTLTENGVSKVSSTIGTFDENGLTISKSDSDITTTISENGMEIKSNKVLLTADKEGVKAEDLHATSYLIIGKYSRFEDMPKQTRTACFWIGG